MNKKCATPRTLLFLLLALVSSLVLLTGVALAGPAVSLTNLREWQEAINDGRIQPVTAWNTAFEHHYPGQVNSLRFVQLTPMDGFSWPFEEATPGVLMEIGGGQPDPADLVGAWIYTYGADPDLTNQIISIGVYPPAGISSVALGLKDASGRIKSWAWNVGPTGPLFPDRQVPIVINPMLGAGQAGANSFFMDPGFDLTQVVGLIFGEQGNWLNFLNPSPLGNLKPWNYWKNLTVTPNTANKWTQPPYQIGIHNNLPLFWGWDEPSYEPTASTWGSVRRLADDWYCDTTLPVTGIRWWGSFVGWMEESAPAVAPTGFIFEIYTDVPAGSSNPYSHPGQQVWTYTAPTVQGQFIGYDNFSGAMDSCFYYNVTLPAGNYFWQNPSQNQIYWLCIRPIYGSGVTIQYPWGWKTRTHNFQDDAVGEIAANPLWSPIRPGWDLTFELLTSPTATKWSQPPVQQGTYNGKPLFYGWDEPGVVEIPGTPKKAADDWRCTTRQPVTGIEWWGSYLNWTQIAPPQSPGSFWFGIYSDVPPTGTPGAPYSHPGNLIWEYETSQYDQRIAGYDTLTNSPTGAIADSCFKYKVTIPKANWYYQQAQSPHPLADDWKCTTPDPVRTIQWWGSYANWRDNVTTPAVKPITFKLQIYTDVPVDATNSYSHPGTRVWEYVPTAAQIGEQFVGYDRDPHTGKIADSAFLYTVNLPSGSEFTQPTTQQIFWLAITPVYGTGVLPDNPWGWKTRPHYFQDYAVHETSSSPGWEPIEAGWDLAFRLTSQTGQPSKWDQPPVVIGNYNGSPIFNGWDELPPNIFWLSIVAKFPAPPPYEWGWKTRPHFWNDDAVRTTQDSYNTGFEPLLGLDNKSWDLAFVLRSQPKLNFQVTLSEFTRQDLHIPAQIKLRDTSGANVRDDSFFLPVNGQDLTVDALEPGNYDLLIEVMPHWLRKKLGAIAVSTDGELTFSTDGVVLTSTDGVLTISTDGAIPDPGALTNGDCNGDNAVDTLDLSLLLPAIDQIFGPMNSPVDLDGDGEVTSTDLSILLMNVNRMGDE